MLAMDPARPASPHWRRPIHSIVAGQKAESNGTALPSLGFLDIEKIKREAADNDQLKNPTSATTISTAPSLTSPQSMYPAPPFSYPSSSASSVHGLTGYISPPESRRTSDDDKDAPGRARISLPSIHDALGKDPSMLYSSGPPSSVSIPASSSSQVSAMSPTVSIPRSHPDPILPGPRNPYTPVPPVHSSQPLSYYGGESQDHRGPPILRQGSFSDNPSLSRVSAHDSAPASAHSASPTSPIPPVRPSPHLLHPTQVPPPYPPGPPSIAPQPSYRPFQPAFSYPPHTPGTVGYAPANYNNQPTWRGDGFEIDRAEEVRKAAAKRSPGGGQHYGESVKRHLDIFDLETSLNEVLSSLYYTTNSS